MRGRVHNPFLHLCCPCSMKVLWNGIPQCLDAGKAIEFQLQLKQQHFTVGQTNRDRLQSWILGLQWRHAESEVTRRRKQLYDVTPPEPTRSIDVAPLVYGQICSTVSDVQETARANLASKDHRALTAFSTCRDRRRKRRPRERRPKDKGTLLRYQTAAGCMMIILTGQVCVVCTFRLRGLFQFFSISFPHLFFCDVRMCGDHSVQTTQTCESLSAQASSLDSYADLIFSKASHATLKGTV